MPFMIPPDSDVTFATIDELAIRLGKLDATQLTAEQRAQGEMLLVLATGLITQAVNRDTAWAEALAPIPTMLRAVCLEMVARVMNNLSGARSESEQLGQYQHSASFTDDAHRLMLTASERTLCRRIVLGSTSGSASVESLVDKLAVNVPTPLSDLVEAGRGDPPVYDWTDA